MPTTGFDETVTEGEWSKTLAPATRRGVVYAPDDWYITPVAGLPRVRILKGTGQAAGIVHTTTGDYTLDLQKPASGGRWYMVCATYDFVRKLVEFRAIPHNTTGDSSANLAPQFMPTSLRARPSEVWDQPLAFVWVHSGNKGLETADLRINREGDPANSGRRQRYDREGNTFDNLVGNFNTDTAAIVGRNFNNFPRGDVRYYVHAIVRSVASGGAGAAGRVRVTVNGNVQNEDAHYLFKSDWDSYTYTGTYLHPGGTLSIAAYSSTTSGQVYRDGTKIEVDWSPSGGIPE